MNPTSLTLRRLLALSLALLMLCSMMPVRSFAAQENTPKEEVVYIKLDASGAVEEINVVNIFTLAKAGTITDYGSYETLRNMTSTTPIDYQGNTVTIQADAGKLYYEGKLSSNLMPWNIAIHYFIDGKEYSSEKVAGQSGKLKITMDITRNDRYQGSFFEGFALQVSLTLDTAKCSNIFAPDATVANVGSSKQLTHTILPGNGAHLEITADVVDFTMDGIAINGIPLNLNVEVDNEALMDQVNELLDAIAQLDDGASTLHQGISTLQKGAKNDLASGSEELYDGMKELEEGASELYTGGTTLLTGAQELLTGTTALNEGVQALNTGIAQMQTALNTLHAESPTLANGSDAYLAALKLLQETLSSVAVTNSDLSALADASSSVLDGLTQLVNGAEALEQNISFSALKSIMAQNGLDVNTLQSNNDTAMSQLRAAIDENQQFVETLKMLGYDVSGLFSQLEQVILLLGANNAFIDGAGRYLDTVSSNMSELAYNAALLQTNYAVFDSKISQLTTALGSLAENMTALTSAVNTLVSEYQKVDSGIDTYTGAVAEIVAAYTEIASGSATLASSVQELETGTTTLQQGTSDLLDGILELYNGTTTLREGSDELNSGITELVSGISKIYDGSSQLEDGTATVRNETAGMDTTITNKIDDMLANITGENVALASFVDEDNTNVDSVQFVIKTAAIQHQVQTQEIVSETQELTFWEKLRNLVGLLF